MKNLEEANLSHLREKFKNYDIATISASRDSYNRNEKRDMNKSLRDDLMNSPYEVITIQGGYPETVDNSDETKDVKERSFFVVNYSNYDEAKTKAFEDFMFGLCDKYNQDSIFIKTNNIPAGLYDRDRNVVDFGDGPMNNMTKLNSDPKQPYYSRINGSKFSFQKESTEGKSMFRQLVERVLAENGYEDFLQKSIEDLQILDSQIKSLNEYGEVRIADPLQRKQLINYCNSDEGFEKCDFDPNDLRVEDDLIYLA